jgi:hypothetical protein
LKSNQKKALQTALFLQFFPKKCDFLKPSEAEKQKTPQKRKFYPPNSPRQALFCLRTEKKCKNYIAKNQIVIEKNAKKSSQSIVKSKKSSTFDDYLMYDILKKS